MRLFVCTMSIVLLAVSPSYSQSNDALCKDLGDIAQSIMEERQRGIALSDTIKIADQIVVLRDNIRAMVIAAHEKPRYSTPEMQTAAMADFRSEVELVCFQSQKQE